MTHNLVKKIRYSSQVTYDADGMALRYAAPIHNPILHCLDLIVPNNELEIECPETKNNEPLDIPSIQRITQNYDTKEQR